MSKFTKIAGFAGCALLASTPALSADIAARLFTKAAPMPVQSWTGAYIGGTAGYGWGESRSDVTAIEPFLAQPYQRLGMLPRAQNPSLKGFMGGGEVGYNWQSGQWVAGVEADISYSALQGDETYSVPEVPGNSLVAMAHSAKLDWFGTVRARTGALVTRETLLFATGGLAYGRIKTSTNIVSTDPAFTCARANVALCSAGSASETKIGWTIGGGLETKISTGWTAKIEYFYFDLGSVSDTAHSTSTLPVWNGQPIVGVKSDITGNVVRVGVNYLL